MPRWPLILALAALAGCGDRLGPPAPYAIHGPPGVASTVPAGPHPDRVTVAGGDTLYGLSRHWGVPMRAIIDANGLSPPYRLVAGASLVLPQVRTHTVLPGETLTAVARQQGVDASTLAATNHLATPYVIRTGEVLVLPAPIQMASAPPPLPAERPAPSAAVMRAPIVPAPLPIAAEAPPPSGTRVLAVSPLAAAQPLGAAPPLAMAPPPPAPQHLPGGARHRGSRAVAGGPAAAPGGSRARTACRAAASRPICAVASRPRRPSCHRPPPSPCPWRRRHPSP